METKPRYYPEYYAALAEFIAIRSIAGNSGDNRRALTYITSMLEALDFHVCVKGAEVLEQPVIVAKRPPVNSDRKLVLYGHYDVAPPGDSDSWITGAPFTLQSQSGRIFGRGVADNKGTLLTRILALVELLRQGESLPEILFLIQGKEEVTTPCPVTREIFIREIAAFNADLFMDETGFNDLDDGSGILFLWSKSSEALSASKSSEYLAMTGMDRVEWRHLNKLNGGEHCPFLNALPANALYIGFGPNDRLHRIHRTNESLSEDLLEKHFVDFYRFISIYAQQ